MERMIGGSDPWLGGRWCSLDASAGRDNRRTWTSSFNVCQPGRQSNAQRQAGLQTLLLSDTSEMGCGRAASQRQMHQLLKLVCAATAVKVVVTTEARLRCFRHVPWTGCLGALMPTLPRIPFWRWERRSV